MAEDAPAPRDGAAPVPQPATEANAATAPLALVARPSATALPLAPAVVQPPAVPTSTRPCPHCGQANVVQATLCQLCGRQMTRPCPTCGFANPLGQTVCARCGCVTSEYDQRRFDEGLVAEHRVQRERREADSSAEALEAAHRDNAMRGIVFWIAMGAVSLGLFLSVLVMAGVFSSVLR